MQASNSGSQATSSGDFRAGVPEVIGLVLAGASGFTVRCTPRRRTVMVGGPDGRPMFAKLRDGDYGRAKAEWRWLHLLPMLGLAVPQPVAFQRTGASSLLCTAAAPGRPADALIAEALRSGDRAAVVEFACRAVAPRVALLHDQGLVFRDLYWNHLFAESLAGDEVTFVDVERVFRPRWRKWRWGVKDLAGLAASFPGEVSAREGVCFLRAYLGRNAADRRLRRRLFRAVLRKARRIRAHQPRYG